MRTFISPLIALSALTCLAACGGAADSIPLDPPRSTAVRAPDGSIRVPFLGGAFVTRNRAMPPDVEQAIAGEPTDHPVVVWAGD